MKQLQFLCSAVCLVSYAGAQISPSPNTQSAGAFIQLNEVRVDQDGADNDEYFEILASPGATLDGETYIVIGDGSAGSGVIEVVVDLGGLTVDAGGYFLVAESSYSLGGTVDLTTSLNFENSDNVTHLIVHNFTGSNGDDLDTDDDGVLDVTPWDFIRSGVSLIDNPSGGEWTYYSDSVDNTGHAYRCADTSAWEPGDVDITAGTDTPDAANPDCEDPLVYMTMTEIRIDQDGTDDDEYFELFGNSASDLSGLTYIVIGDGAGGSGVVESITDLTGSIVGASGYFVVAESTFTLGTPDLIATLGFENGDNVTHMLVRDFTGASQDDLDTDDDGVLDVTPWSEILDSVALIEDPSGGDHVYSTTTVGPDGNFVPPHVFLCEDGWRIGEFDVALGSDTPGAVGDCSPRSEFETYCVAFPNSAFVDGARMGWMGSGNIADNDTVVTVGQCPNTFGMFFFGESSDLVIPFGNGALCVGGALTRLLPISKASGNVNQYVLDFTLPPTDFVANDERYFQYWFRDAGQGSGSNTSDGLRVRFAE